MIAGGAVAALALVPGLPKIPFLLVGGRHVPLRPRPAARQVAGAEARASSAASRRRPPRPSRQRRSRSGPASLAIDPLELSIGFGLVPLVDERAGGSLLARVGVVRRQIAAELGLVIGPVRVHDDVQLDSHEYAIKVRGVEVARGRVIPGHRLAMNPGDAMPGLAGIPTIEPAFGLPAVWIDEGARAEAEALGYTVVDAESVVVTHLTETIRRHADELLTRQETKALLDALREQNAAAVEEVVPDKLGVGEVQRVLQALLREGVSIRDLGTIARGDRRPRGLHARPGRARRARPRSRSRARSPPATSTTSARCRRSRSTRTSSRRSPSRSRTRATASCSPSTRTARRSSSRRSRAGSRSSPPAGRRPVLVCSSRLRRHVRRLVEQRLPQLPVLAYNEIVPGIRVEAAGTVVA